ncbi:zinc finger protein swm [Anaeramoeba ignava]|uniref:Zinc finger protein swm n=1 Tax=Anaeramoeba ignava TaxID=1746090 RepID=A0A9Q0RAA7_ANAIG|nr:zinc finger protein swm [Anaeramoeba ignava]
MNQKNSSKIITSNSETEIIESEGSSDNEADLRLQDRDRKHLTNETKSKKQESKSNYNEYSTHSSRHRKHKKDNDDIAGHLNTTKSRRQKNRVQNPFPFPLQFPNFIDPKIGQFQVSQNQSIPPFIPPMPPFPYNKMIPPQEHLPMYPPSLFNLQFPNVNPNGEFSNQKKNKEEKNINQNKTNKKNNKFENSNNQPFPVGFSSTNNLHRSYKSKKNPKFDPTIKCLLVKNIRKKINNQHFLQKHFIQFGKIESIQIHQEDDSALVEFSTRQEAEKAFHSEKAIGGNRFIKLFWNSSNISSENPNQNENENQNQNQNENLNQNENENENEENSIESEKRFFLIRMEKIKFVQKYLKKYQLLLAQLQNISEEKIQQKLKEQLKQEILAHFIYFDPKLKIEISNENEFILHFSNRRVAELAFNEPGLFKDVHELKLSWVSEKNQNENLNENQNQNQNENLNQNQNQNENENQNLKNQNEKSK